MILTELLLLLFLLLLVLILSGFLGAFLGVRTEKRVVANILPEHYGYWIGDGPRAFELSVGLFTPLS
jgi:hypothetical protein